MEYILVGGLFLCSGVIAFDVLGKAPHCGSTPGLPGMKSCIRASEPCLACARALTALCSAVPCILAEVRASPLL